MRNYFKKFSIIFMMSFALMLGCSVSAFASATYWKSNDNGNGCISLSNDNHTATIMSSKPMAGSIILSNKYRTSGKWYCELKIDSLGSKIDRNSTFIGVVNDIFNTYTDTCYSTNQLAYYSYNGDIYPSNSVYGDSFTTNDIISIAIDIDNKKIKFAKNGKWYNELNLPKGNGYNIYLSTGSSINTDNISTINFGDTSFVYDIPNGYLPYTNDVTTGISLNSSTLTLPVNDSKQLTATTTPAGAQVTWKSSDSSVATVDSTGKVTGVKEGSCTITATTADGLTASCIVTVTKENKSISLSKTSTNLAIDDSETLIATTTPAGISVKWSSSDTSVATVDSNGKVTAIGAGTATITATTLDGSNLSASCIVTVVPKGNGPTPAGSEYITNIAHAKGTNTNNPGGEVTIIFHGSADTILSVIKTADVKEVWIGDNFTYTLVITNTGTKTAKAVVVNDPAPNHINFNVSGVTTTQGSIDSSSTSKNIIVNVGDILPGGTVTIKIPSTVIA